MIAPAEVLRSIYAAARLARLDATAVGLFDGSRGAAARSFFAAVLLAPVYLTMLAFDMVENPPTVGAGRLFLVEGLTYVVSWAAFPAVMTFLVKPLGRQAELFRMIAAYNWSAIIQVAILVPVELVYRLGLIPLLLSEFLLLLAGLAVLAYVWFVLKSSLQVSGPMAALLVTVDLVLALTIIEWSDNLVGG